MITNKDDFTKKRKTRIEILEERIIAAQNMINELNQELKEEGEKEISKLESVLNDLRLMKEKLIEKEKLDNEILDEELRKMNNDSLLIINNEKVRVVLENEKLKSEKKEKDDQIKKLQEEILKLNLSLKNYKNKEDKLNEDNAILQEKFKNLESKAYGYDIAKKFETHQNKLNTQKRYPNIIDPNKYRAIEDDHLANNFWEREKLTSNKSPSKLDDLAKQKGLWIGNSSSNIEKLMNDVNISKRNEVNLNMAKYSDSINTNMRKFSPMILNNSSILK
jgi:chromosome segregation ATPase